jgi:hypothetical protein
MARLLSRRQQINADKAEIRRIKRIARLRLIEYAEFSVGLMAACNNNPPSAKQGLYIHHFMFRTGHRKKPRKRETIVNCLIYTDLVTEEEFLEMFHVTKNTFQRLHQFLYHRIDVPTSILVPQN